MSGLLMDPTKPLSLIEMVNSPSWIGVKPTIGQRYNNPGNMRSNDPFQGKTGQGKGGYDQYDTLANGARALARDLHTKSKRGVNNVRDLMTGYAPPSDNNPTDSYIDYVAKALGVSPDENIDLAKMRPQLMRAITKFENKNRDILNDDMITQAILAADGESSDMAQNNYLPPRQGISEQRFPSIAPVFNNGITGRDAFDELERRSNVGQYNYEPRMSGDDYRDLGQVSNSQVTAVPEGKLTFEDVIANEQAARQSQADAIRPVLENTEISGDGALSNPGLTNNTRSQSALSLPSYSIPLGERMMRMGAAGLSRGGEGAQKQLGAMFGASNDVDQFNRETSIDLYNKSLEAQAAKQKDFGDDADTILKYDQTLAKFDKGLGYVQGQGLTGPWDGFVKGFLDKVGGNENAAKRLLLEELKVDDILIRIAQTKGAISNKEMDIFARPAPSVGLDDEKTWRTWIELKSKAMRDVRNRLAERSGAALNTGPISGAGGTYSAEDQALIAKYQ